MVNFGLQTAKNKTEVLTHPAAITPGVAVRSVYIYGSVKFVCIMHSLQHHTGANAVVVLARLCEY